MNHQSPQPNPADHSGPIAGPLASNPPVSSPLAERQSAGIPSGNIGAPRGTTEPSRRTTDSRLSAAALDAITHRLSDRDRSILRSVDDHQFLTVSHIESLYFQAIAPDARSRITRRVLARLRGMRVLDTLDRRIGGVRAGSQGLIYHVGVAGDRILPRSVRRRARLRYEPSVRFLDHRLAAADAHVALIAAHRGRLLELTESAVEPATWRTYTGIGAARRTLKPDLFAETADASDLVRAWFVEIDLGTEHLPTLLTKCREYERYRQTGIEQDRHGAFPLVVWSMTHPDPATAERRRDALIEAITKDRQLTSALFRIVAPEQLLPLVQRGGSQ